MEEKDSYLNVVGAVSWQKWVGEYKGRLGQESKTHGVTYNEDGEQVLICGKAIPEYADGYEVQGQAEYHIDCKRCNKIIETYSL